MQTEKQNWFRVISGNQPDKQPEKELSLVIIFRIVFAFRFHDVNHVCEPTITAYLQLLNMSIYPMTKRVMRLAQLQHHD